MPLVAGPLVTFCHKSDRKSINRGDVQQLWHNFRLPVVRRVGARDSKNFKT